MLRYGRIFVCLQHPTTPSVSHSADSSPRGGAWLKKLLHQEKQYREDDDEIRAGRDEEARGGKVDVELVEA